MSGNMDAPAENIVIIRRKSCGEDDCHHGGVWKIAYADFMTAMMAFFLVMWLINAANTEVKASVASYFNPMRLTDSVARSKGLKDAPDSKSDQKDKKRESEAEQGSQSAPGDATSGSGGGKDSTGEAGPPRKQAFDFDDEATGARRNVANSKSAALPGTAFRDPFNPLNPAQMLPVESTSETQAAPPADPASGSASIDAPAGKSASIDPVEADKASAARVEKTVPAPAATQPAGDEDAAETAQDAKERREMAALVDQVGKATRDAAARLGLSGGPAVDVTMEGDMVVVSLAETASFEMFKVGSAEPNGDLVKLLGTIVPAITANNERLIIRGHTDARPFRNAAKNNWQLSVERAEAAFQILLKAGVDESRFERIEAHADQMLKNKADPEAASNRRIEILLRKSSG